MRGRKQDALHDLDVHEALGEGDEHRRERVHATLGEDVIGVHAESPQVHPQVRGAVATHQTSRGVQQDAAVRVVRDLRVGGRGQREEIEVHLVETARRFLVEIGAMTVQV